MFKYANEELGADTTSLGLAEPNQWFEGENSFFPNFPYSKRKEFARRSVSPTKFL